MTLSRNKLYLLLTFSCMAGYIWLYLNHIISTNNQQGEFGICLFRNITNIPCPSCGSTRSIASLLKGDISSALYWNPLGLVIAIILVVLPFWLLYDFITLKDTLLRFYIKTEAILRKKKVAVMAILLILGNWIWNIYKGL